MLGKGKPAAIPRGSLQSPDSPGRERLEHVAVPGPPGPPGPGPNLGLQTAALLHSVCMGGVTQLATRFMAAVTIPQ